MHRALADETRTQLMRIPRTADRPLDAHALSEQLGLHLTTVRALANDTDGSSMPS